MRRVSVVGSSGSGKSRVARRLATALDAPYVELDALHWGSDWTAASPEELRERVDAATRGDRWVVDGNYQGKIGTLVQDRADTVVWVNPPRWRSMWQVTTRTWRRVLTRQELWNGNRETAGGLRFWIGEESVLWWAWNSYDMIGERYEAAMSQAPATGVAWHRLRSRREVERFLSLSG
jgi:adenylate kinase family enzyme